MKKNRKNQKGFTLIELIVVIAILGILAMVAVPRLAGFQEKAKTSADVATFETIDRAIAIGAANEVFVSADATTAGTVVLSTDADGIITFTGTANSDVATEMAKLVESNPRFKKATHFSLATTTALTWSIAADGTITKPTLP